MPQKITIYGHSYCPQVHTVRAALEHFGIAYDYVDIRKDDPGRLRVREINNGFESVPTLAFVDGSTLTEPSEDALYLKLEALGYDLNAPSSGDRLRIYLGNPVISAFGFGVVLGGGVFGSGWMVGVGMVLIILPVITRFISTRS